jgi:hypothetical protein
LFLGVDLCVRLEVYLMFCGFFHVTALAKSSAIKLNKGRCRQRRPGTGSLPP